MDQQRVVDDYSSLYIPRVALTVSSSSNKSYSKHRQKWSEEGSDSDDQRRTSRKEMYFVHKGPKRGGSHTTASSSSSSLSSSNRSNYSVNSLLLSVENLENFNRTNNAVNQPNRLKPNSFVFDTQSDQKQQMMENIKNILAVEDLSLTTGMNDEDVKKTKDPDELSSASSITTTNFTVVTFNDSHRRAIKSKSFCRRSHQVTILILVMTFIFVIGISALVCALEMRFQNMPR